MFAGIRYLRAPPARPPTVFIAIGRNAAKNDYDYRKRAIVGSILTKVVLKPCDKDLERNYECTFWL